MTLVQGHPTNSHTLVKKILILTANPIGTTPVRLEKEVREIDKGLKQAKYGNRFVLEQRWAVNLKDIRQAILEVEPQIIHFSGYGAGDEGLVFQDENGQPKPVDAPTLEALFEGVAGKVECVVLNACYWEVQAEAIARHVPYAIGIKQGIGDKSAIEFAVGFYDALGAGRPVELAHRYSCSTLLLEKIPAQLAPILKKSATLHPKETERRFLRKQASIPTAPTALPVTQAIELFFCYAREDEKLRDEFVKHLSELRREGVITAWYDRQITTGKEWVGQINPHVNTARIILLLVSSHFLASDYCYDVELTRALERHSTGEACVMAILLRPTDWQIAPLNKLPILPEGAKPVTTLPSPEDAFQRISKSIRKATENVKVNYLHKLQHYEQELAKTLQQQYPLSPPLRHYFHQLQRNLRLPDEDVAEIEHQIISKMQKDRQKLLFLLPVLAVATLGMGFLWGRFLPLVGNHGSGSWIPLYTAGEISNFREPERFSRGERSFFRDFPGIEHIYRDRGIEAFKKGDYSAAANFFETAIKVARNDPQIQIDPELQIYLNNAKARQAGYPLTIAAIISQKNPYASLEILRGVADAQTQFNNAGGRKNRLVEIVIANDDDNPEKSKEVAQQLANEPTILGVVGHLSSDASQAALIEYEKKHLPMVSATSTATSLGRSNSVFFRTVPSDKAAGEKLAEYTQKTLQKDKVVVFYNSNSKYSQSLYQVFKNAFETPESQVVDLIDLSNSDRDPRTALEMAVEKQVGAAVLFPSLDQVSVSIDIARFNARLPKWKRLQLLGGDTLYTSTTLINGKDAVEGLILAITWYPDQQYAQTATRTWEGQINWVTAMSYDATQALVKALSTADNPSSRDNILQKLKLVNLLPSETSGEPLQFSSTGERQGKSVLVRVVKAKGGPESSSFIFERIDPKKSPEMACNVTNCVNLNGQVAVLPGSPIVPVKGRAD